MGSKWRAFLRGVGSILDLSGGSFRAQLNRDLRKLEREQKNRKSDAEEMADDWRQVGDHLRSAMRTVDKSMGVDISGGQNQQPGPTSPVSDAHKDSPRASGKDPQATETPLQEEKDSQGVEGQA